MINHVNVLDRIKELCKAHSITISRLEDDLNIGKNSIYTWKTKNPSSEKLVKVADYFNVSIDFLLGRTLNKYFNQSIATEKNIEKKFEELIEYLKTKEKILFFGVAEQTPEETKQFLILTLENSHRLGKEMAKRIYSSKST